MKIHELKTHAAPFNAVWSGAKGYEIRKSDRDFKVGDILWLRDFAPLLEVYGERSMLAEVTHLTPGGEWGLPPDLCVMSILVLDRRPRP